MLFKLFRLRWFAACFLDMLVGLVGTVGDTAPGGAADVFRTEYPHEFQSGIFSISVAAGGAAFTRTWRVGQTERGNSASKRTGRLKRRPH